MFLQCHDCDEIPVKIFSLHGSLPSSLLEQIHTYTLTHTLAIRQLNFKLNEFWKKKSLTVFEWHRFLKRRKIRLKIVVYFVNGQRSITGVALSIKRDDTSRQKKILLLFFWLGMKIAEGFLSNDYNSSGAQTMGKINRKTKISQPGG